MFSFRCYSQAIGSYPRIRDFTVARMVEAYQRNPHRFLDALDVVLDGSKQPGSM